MATYSSKEVFRPDIALAMEQFDEEADREAFIGNMIAPVYDTKLAGSEFPVTPIESILQDVDDERASSGDYATVDGKVSWDSYSTRDHGVAERVDDRQRSLNLTFWDDEVMAARRTRDAVLRNRERRIIEAVTGSSIGSTALDNAKRYTAYADATPIDDFRTQLIAIREACGVSRGIYACADWETILHMKSCEQVIDRAAFGAGSAKPKTVSHEHLAEILGVTGLIEANSVRNTNARGSTAAATLKPIWPRNQILLFVRSTTPDTRKFQFMRTFHYSADGSKIGGTFETWYSPDKRSHMVRHRLDVAEKIMYAACARRITNTTSAA